MAREEEGIGRGQREREREREEGKRQKRLRGSRRGEQSWGLKNRRKEKEGCFD